jgi:plasmid stability protein
MATLTIRNVDQETHRALRVRAAQNGRSVEEEVRRLLADHVRDPGGYANPRTPEEISAAVKRAQKLFAPMRKSYSVDRFLAEKHAEVQRELSDNKKTLKRK